ncbi:hypothetical protein CDCA_CDCA08G2474 [Cyanidium caldarium]|uniref:Uncharacterized protein n=1 Tax=Cyanidium caldarium TaxID=2771 RepID=A0AAV9IWE7_CYACA|nr:hypothetical protein CDCA_CDCA08G2474 [Cyanidium caldarium]
MRETLDGAQRAPPVESDGAVIFAADRTPTDASTCQESAAQRQPSQDTLLPASRAPQQDEAHSGRDQAAPARTPSLSEAHRRQFLTGHEVVRRATRLYVNVAGQRASVTDVTPPIAGAPEVLQRSGLMSGKSADEAARDVQHFVAEGNVEEGLAAWLLRASHCHRIAAHTMVSAAKARIALESLHRWSQRLERGRLHAGDEVIFRLEPLPNLFVMLSDTKTARELRECVTNV